MQIAILNYEGASVTIHEIGEQEPEEYITNVMGWRVKDCLYMAAEHLEINIEI